MKFKLDIILPVYKKQIRRGKLLMYTKNINNIRYETLFEQITKASSLICFKIKISLMCIGRMKGHSKLKLSKNTTQYETYYLCA